MGCKNPMNIIFNFLWRQKNIHIFLITLGEFYSWQIYGLVWKILMVTIYFSTNLPIKNEKTIVILSRKFIYMYIMYIILFMFKTKITRSYEPQATQTKTILWFLAVRHLVNKNNALCCHCQIIWRVQTHGLPTWINTRASYWGNDHKNMRILLFLDTKNIVVKCN